MGRLKDYKPIQAPYRGRNPLTMSGHIFQRAVLLMLLAFFATYTFVNYFATRSVLTQCAELASYGTTTPKSVVSLPSTVPTASMAAGGLDKAPSQVSAQVRQKVQQEVQEPLSEATKSPAISKVSMIYGPHARDDTMKSIMEGHRKHAARHGHGLHILERQLLHGLWSKHAWMMHIMLQEMQKPEDLRTQWLAWFDTDIIIMNPEVPLDVFLPPEDGFSDIKLLCANDHNGLNNGAFMIRVGEWGVRYFVDSLALHTYKPDVKLKYSEQSAMEHTITMDKYANKTMFVPQRWFNAYKGPRNDQGRLIRGQKVPPNTIMPGDLQLHFAGKKTTKALMPSWVALAANESSGWSVPLEQTKLRSEVALFWKLEREKREWNVPVLKPKKGGQDKSEISGKESDADGVQEALKESTRANGEVDGLAPLEVQGRSDVGEVQTDNELADNEVES